MEIDIANYGDDTKSYTTDFTQENIVKLLILINENTDKFFDCLSKDLHVKVLHKENLETPTN